MFYADVLMNDQSLKNCTPTANCGVTCQWGEFEVSERPIELLEVQEAHEEVCALRVGYALISISEPSTREIHIFVAIDVHQ